MVSQDAGTSKQYSQAEDLGFWLMFFGHWFTARSEFLQLRRCLSANSVALKALLLIYLHWPDLLQRLATASVPTTSLGFLGLSWPGCSAAHHGGQVWRGKD